MKTQARMPENCFSSMKLICLYSLLLSVYYRNNRSQNTCGQAQMSDRYYKYSVVHFLSYFAQNLSLLFEDFAPNMDNKIKSLIFPVKNLKEEKHDKKKKKQINAHQSLLYYSYSTGNSSLESPSQMRMETDWVNQQKQLSRQLLRWLYQGSLWLLLAWVRTSSVVYSSWL